MSLQTRTFKTNLLIDPEIMWIINTRPYILDYKSKPAVDIDKPVNSDFGVHFCL